VHGADGSKDVEIAGRKFRELIGGEEGDIRLGQLDLDILEVFEPAKSERPALGRYRCER
jgi:hypothetical protein